MYRCLPKKLISLAKSCPFPLYVVGGFVRDNLSGLCDSSPDIDICAPAEPEDFIAIAKSEGFAVCAVYRNTGAVKISVDGFDFEFTSFRSDEYIRGEHTPAKTFFTHDINLDARRRDFTCNAVYYDIAARAIVDPLGGVEDIDNRRIRTVAPAEKVFGEDGLRLMRLARIAGETGFLPTAECLEGARKNAQLIKDVSVERIYAELDLILHADKKSGISLGQYTGLKVLDDIGVLEILLPELCEGKGVVQRRQFHKYDVFEHSLRAVAYSDESVRLAALLHDVGKPYCLKHFQTFAEHDEHGARIALAICERLKVPKKLAAETAKLIELHMYDFRGDAKENKVRKFIVENYGVYEKLLLLKQADFTACKDDPSRAPVVVKMRKIYEKMKDEDIPFSLKELNVKGNDLQEIGMPNEKIGDILEKLLLDCCIKLVANDREKLIIRASKVYLAPLIKEGAVKSAVNKD